MTHSESNSGWKSAKSKRMRHGELDVVRIGHNHPLFHDLYVYLLQMPWALLLVLTSGFYLLSNVAFAYLYYLDPGGVLTLGEANSPKTFSDCFFFSVQTMATIGYGRMVPFSFASNILATIEALWGFIYFAFITGLMFAKFSRPTARVMFSKVGVISGFEGRPHLKIRLANRRDNRIVDVTARLFLLRHTMTKEGFVLRRFYDLKLVRDFMPMTQFTWTLLHPIDEDSPLYGISKEEFEKSTEEILVTIVGLDETMMQTIHARHSYFADEIKHGSFFEDVVKRTDNAVEVNYSLFHSVRDTPPRGWV